jgi:hypothetical protein
VSYFERLYRDMLHLFTRLLYIIAGCVTAVIKKQSVGGRQQFVLLITDII